MEKAPYEELHSLYRSPNIIRVIKSRIFRWAGHVARMKESRSAFKIVTGIPTGNSPLGWLLKKYISLRGIGLIQLRIGIIRESL